MAQFRTSADLVDRVLTRAGEPTNGNSALEADALEYLNLAHHYVVAGGNEIDIEIDEPWVWAREKYPMTIELLPKYDTGTVSLTNGSEAGTFSSAPSDSKKGWYLRLKTGNDSSVYRIASHTAGASAFELDGDFLGTTNATATFKVFKLDYELTPSYLVIDRFNDRIDFEETASTELTASLTHGAYTPSDLATHIKTQLESAGASTYTISYDGDTKKFTLASDLGGGGGTFKLLAQSGTNVERSTLPLLGFDIEDQATAASHTGNYIIGGISRLLEPVRIHNVSSRRGSIELVDQGTMQVRFPLSTAEEGYPRYMSLIRETDDGCHTVRFDRYPDESVRIEIPYMAIPKDLKDNAASVPLVPRKDNQVLVYIAAYFLCLDKEDTKAQDYLALAQRKLRAMLSKNRSLLQRASETFAEILPRTDELEPDRHLEYGYMAGRD